MMYSYEAMQRMMGDWGGMGFFMWLNYLIFLALVLLSIAALIKYLKK